MDIISFFSSLTSKQFYSPDEFLNKGDAQEIVYAAEDLFAKKNSTDKEIFKKYLNFTGRKSFLKLLNDEELLLRWSETAFKALQGANYGLYDLFESRLVEHPERLLFQDMRSGMPLDWTYRQSDKTFKQYAEAFYNVRQEEPRAAIISENSYESACCDLACLMFGIYDTVLNTHFNSSIIQHIFEALKINIVIVDTAERYSKLSDIRVKSGIDFTIFTIQEGIEIDERKDYHLGEYSRRKHFSEIEKFIQQLPAKPVNEVATTMFTSGSTGMPKGVSFSIYNIVSKRFARAAALPDAGEGEVMLCYLPLFHTFGRYLELMGTIYWGGAYIFTGNPSSDTLLALFPKTNPSAFISVPVRWKQLYDRCIEDLAENEEDNEQREIIKKIIGERLNWGLSAAGYLDPKVFIFFQNNGVNLCSGFGMTEATGGITMTPPGKYIKSSVGKPLPGVKIRLTEIGEMEISGHYIARYLEDKGPGDIIEFPKDEQSDYWLPTGDIFREIKDGYYEIVDRVKDIYKNSKGQTVAPRVVENKFTGVPGIKRTFLAGDGRAYNVLFIIPDLQDSVIKDMPEGETIRDYYSKIVSEANRGLAPYERVVNFAILDRDFELEKKELTPKGSFNRKQITQNFSEIIDELYKRNELLFNIDGIEVKVPRWFIRDLGILESDITGSSKGLQIKTGGFLEISNGKEKGQFKIGDLIYIINSNVIDLGVFARNPILWSGNPELIEFSPVKEGWDSRLRGVSPQVLRPKSDYSKFQYKPVPKLDFLRNPLLREVNQFVFASLFSDNKTAIEAIKDLEKLLYQNDIRIVELIRRRLEALAMHPSEEIRCLAYRILLMDEPAPDYKKYFPAFIKSGMKFLNEETINYLAKNKLEKHRLESLRKRLLSYRQQLDWPAEPEVRNQFENIFKLLLNFIDYHPEYYSSVRVELANWRLHEADPELAKIAKKYFAELADRYEEKLAERTPYYSKKDWEDRIVFDDEISANEIARIKDVIINTTFLKQSIMLAFDEPDFDIMNVHPTNIWISRLHSTQLNQIYRISINTDDRKHFNLQMVISDDLRQKRNLETIFWVVAISGYPTGPKVLPKLGCCRPELGARSMAYMNELTLWEKIREFSSRYASGRQYLRMNSIRKMFTQSISTFYIGWKNSGKKILPGKISPLNVIIPELDFRESATILSLTDWRNYNSPLSLVKPLIKNFYQKPLINYPWLKYNLDLNWIFDSAIEGLGFEEGMLFLKELENELEEESDLLFNSQSLKGVLKRYIEYTKDNFYMPLPLLNAIDRYEDWESMNDEATAYAREDTILELIRLYRLHSYPEIVRYHLYRNTYFKKFSDEAQKRFDLLLKSMHKHRERPPAHFMELSDLQESILNIDDRNVFNRMVFPLYKKREKIDIIKKGRSEKMQVVVSSEIFDKYREKYILRDAFEPTEIGSLYRLFFKEKFPKTISETDKFYIVLDKNERIIGGICYKSIGEDAVLLDGTVVTSPLKGRGIGSAMLDAFLNRMTSYGVKYVKTHFYLRNFYLNRGFKVDKSWGALVKFLNSVEIEN